MNEGMDNRAERATRAFLAEQNLPMTGDDLGARFVEVCRAEGFEPPLVVRTQPTDNASGYELARAATLAELLDRSISAAAKGRQLTEQDRFVTWEPYRSVGWCKGCGWQIWVLRGSGQRARDWCPEDACQRERKRGDKAKERGHEVREWETPLARHTEELSGWVDTGLGGVRADHGWDSDEASEDEALPMLVMEPAPGRANRVGLQTYEEAQLESDSRGGPAKAGPVHTRKIGDPAPTREELGRA